MGRSHERAIVPKKSERPRYLKRPQLKYFIL
nr:MAG TPA: hypothetical protein [Caudoviricetes sp.]